jgi:hypothetical protein
MSDYIRKLIAQGENQQLDFKFEISDSKKIARSLVAFANTDGGRLLIGVKDNGAIAGVRSEEEYYMVEAAAHLFCKPEVKFQTKEWEIDNKLVLEVIVPRSKEIKHKAPFKLEDYKVYVRVGDKNLLADPILLQFWKREKSDLPVRINFTDPERLLLQHLDEHRSISLTEFIHLAGINKKTAERLLLDFMLMGILKIQLSERETRFLLTQSEVVSHVVKTNFR